MTSAADMGPDFGAGLTAREVDYLVANEWAETADDILWRRTKLGLRLTPAEQEALAAYVTSRASAPHRALAVVEHHGLGDGELAQRFQPFFAAVA